MDCLRTPDERFNELSGYPFAARYLDAGDQDGGTLRIRYLDAGARS